MRKHFSDALHLLRRELCSCKIAFKIIRAGEGQHVRVDGVDTVKHRVEVAEFILKEGVFLTIGADRQQKVVFFSSTMSGGACV